MTDLRAERIQSREAARITGLRLRTLQLLAETGKIPGAGKLGSRWTFDEAKLRRWVREGEDAACRKISIGGAAPGMRASGFTARKSDEAYTRLLGLRQ